VMSSYKKKNKELNQNIIYINFKILKPIFFPFFNT